MEIAIQEWRLTKVHSLKDKIDPKPQYQRGGVWTLQKNRLLIDSILRGMDIPKFYLRETPNNTLFDYEVADGQQRLHAIWEFFESAYSIGNCEIDGVDVSGLFYEDLTSDEIYKDIVDQFKNFKITVSLIKKSSDNEVRTLFARLQMGSPLNQPELRNAVSSNLGTAIDMMGKTHRFFQESTIPMSRFKRQDYVSHIVTLAIFDNTVNLKAYDMMKIYEEYSVKYPVSIFKSINKILTIMADLNLHCGGQIKNKWAFVDFFWLFYRHKDALSDVKFDKMAKVFLDFEQQRKHYNNETEILLDPKTTNTYNRNLYSYIIAFKYSGWSTENITARANVFDSLFLKHIK